MQPLILRAWSRCARDAFWEHEELCRGASWAPLPLSATAPGPGEPSPLHTPSGLLWSLGPGVELHHLQGSDGVPKPCSPTSTSPGKLGLQRDPSLLPRHPPAQALAYYFVFFNKPLVWRHPALELPEACLGTAVSSD